MDSIDVFCEKGVFDSDCTRRILEAGKAAGMAPNFHGDELHPMGSGKLAAEVGARCVSHLEEVSEAGIEAMAAGGVVGVLLPTTAYILRLTPPPARKMIEQGEYCGGVTVGEATMHSTCHKQLACCSAKVSLLVTPTISSSGHSDSRAYSGVRAHHHGAQCWSSSCSALIQGWL